MKYDYISAVMEAAKAVPKRLPCELELCSEYGCNSDYLAFDLADNTVYVTEASGRKPLVGIGSGPASSEMLTRIRDAVASVLGFGYLLLDREKVAFSYDKFLLREQAVGEDYTITDLRFKRKFVYVFTPDPWDDGFGAIRLRRIV